MKFDLQCENLSKQYGSFKAVDDVSFDVKEGSFFSILGPSGCGKTTIMRMIAGFETLTSGDIKIKSKSVIQTPPNKRNVKMVFQHLALFPMMNVKENIAYGLYCQGIKNKKQVDEKVNEVLEKIRLPSVGEKQIHQLSGGQKQRIAIARCMVLEPDVLLLDEPLGALDLKLRESMKIELKLLQHQFGTTFVYITHDQSEALVMSDQVAVMNNGKFEQIGNPKDLYHRPKTAFVASFVGDTNRWQGQVVAKDDSVITIKTDCGLIKSSITESQRFSINQNVDVFVRPEFMKVRQTNHSEQGAEINSLIGKIDSLLFNGANSRMLIRLDNEQLIEANFLSTTAQGQWQEGEAIKLSWRIEQTLAFVDDR